MDLVSSHVVVIDKSASLQLKELLGLVKTHYMDEFMYPSHPFWFIDQKTWLRKNADFWNISPCHPQRKAFAKIISRRPCLKSSRIHKCTLSQVQKLFKIRVFANIKRGASQYSQEIQLSVFLIYLFVRIVMCCIVRIMLITLALL